jgi:hypothetical protein
MSKKRFTAGLEGLFSAPAEDVKLEEQPRTANGESGSKKGEAGQDNQDIQPKKSTGKHFADDLQAFLTEAFNESLERQLQAEPEPDTELKTPRKTLSGLDALIRTTVEPRHMSISDSPTRRLSLAFDEQKLEKLKTIARLEKTFLRTIIDEIVEDYIKTYEKKKGGI